MRFGAPKEILIDAKPHVGTDKLYFVLQNIRQELLSLGCDIRFGQRLSDLELKDGRVGGVHRLLQRRIYRHRHPGAGHRPQRPGYV